MSFLDVLYYIANGLAWFFAGMYTNILARSRKDKRHG